LIAVENLVEIPLKKVRTGTTLHPNPVPTLNTKAVKVQPHNNNGKKGYQTKMVLKVNGEGSKQQIGIGFIIRINEWTGS
jgi:hypothetical protein